MQLFTSLVGVRRLLAVLAISLLVPFASAQAPADETGPQILPAPPGLLLRFDVAAGTVQKLVVPQAPQAPFAVAVRLGDRTRTLRLHPHDVRAPDFQLLVADENGIRQVPTPPSVTYQGVVEDDVDTAVAATVVDGQLKAVVRLTDGTTWGIQPVSEVDANAGPALHVVYHSSDHLNLPFHCGTQGVPVPVAPGGHPDVNSIAQIACEADYPYYQLLGSNVTATQNDVTGVINGVDLIYRTDVQIQYAITSILVRTSTDPYTSTSAGTLLSQFQAWWNSNQFAVQRDVAHMFTGRNISGSTIGVAYLGTLCNIGSAYGLVQSRYTGNNALRLSLSAHELGHNWNAGHCDAQPDCRIMCSGNGGCTGNVSSFGASERSQIVAFRNTRGCLSQASTIPTLSSITPMSVTVFQPAEVTVTGTGFVGTSQVQVGTATLGPGQFTVASDTTLRFTPPEGLMIGLATIYITNLSGTGGPGVLFYNATNPPKLEVPAVVIGGQTLVWRFGCIPNHPWFLLVSLTNATTPFQGWPLLQGYSVLSVGGLDPVGIGSFSQPIPPNLLNGLTVYSQILDVDPINLVLAGSTPVLPTTVWF